jgi:hypothetical protein
MGLADPVVMATNAFRETLWFKLGEDDNGEAETAPIPLPIEDRYAGEVSAQDSEAYGLHTGTTSYIKIDFKEQPKDTVSLKTLVREMKTKRKLVAIGTCACAVFAAFAMYLA